MMVMASFLPDVNTQIVYEEKDFLRLKEIILSGLSADRTQEGSHAFLGSILGKIA